MTGFVSAAVAKVAGFAGILAETTTLQLNFEPAQMFTYANTITNSMMPLVYISAGFALGFTIIYQLKNAFGGR